MPDYARIGMPGDALMRAMLVRTSAAPSAMADERAASGGV